MLAILNSLDAHNFPIVQPILMIFVSKFIVHRVLSDKTYLSLGLLSPLTLCMLANTYLFLSAIFFSKSTFLKNSFMNTIRESNILDHDQAQRFCRT